MTDDNLKLEPVTIKWLETRGISAAVAAKHGVVTVNGKHPAFEFRDSAGELLYRKARVESPDGSKRFMRDRKGAPAAFFNLASVAQSPVEDDDILIICEGEIDALTWIQAGFKHVLSVPDGAQRQEPGEGDIDPLQDTGFSWMWSANGQLIPELRAFKRIALMTDADSAGAILREELAIRLGPRRCWKMKGSYYKHGYKDANDVLKAGTVRVDDEDVDAEDWLRFLIEECLEPVEPSGIVGIHEVCDEDVELPQWQLSYQDLKDKLILTAPELCVVTGEPGAGKSQFAFHMMMELARLYNLNGLYLQFEDQPKRLSRDAFSYAYEWSKRRGNHEGRHTGDDEHAWGNARLKAVKAPRAGEMAPDQTLQWVEDQIETAVFQNGVKVVIIDPWNEVEHSWKSFESETQYTNNALRHLKGVARRLNICLIIVAHPGKGMQGKTLEECSLYDVSGSAAWNNKADHGVILKRVEMEDTGNPTNMVAIKVSKCKDWETMGRPGTAVLEWNTERGLYGRPDTRKHQAA